MALDQCESGTFKFNKTNFAKVSIKMRKVFNEYHDFSHAVALGVYEVLKAQKVQAQDAQQFIWGLDIKSNPMIRKALTEKKVRTDFELELDLVYFITAEIYRSESNKNTILKPRRSAFPKVSNKEKSFSLEFDCRQLTISVDESTQSILWDIEMNNNNVNTVDNSFYGLLMYPVLREHKWARGEGGYIKTQEENLDDSDGAERYNIDESCHFGSIGEERKSATHRMNAAMYR